MSMPIQTNLAADGSLTLTLPLTITIRLGDAVAAAKPASYDDPFDDAHDAAPFGDDDDLAADDAAMMLVSAPDAAAPSLAAMDDATLEASSPAVAESLRALGRSSDRTYYDEAEDTQARERYYADFAPDGSPAALYDALSELLARTHRRGGLSYDPKQHLYPWVDLHPDGNIVSIYSRRRLDPQRLILADARIDRQRAVLDRFLERQFAASVFTVADLDDSGGNGAQGREPDDLQRKRRQNTVESQLPYNCEHVVPQSWFGKRSPMRGDLHHLFGCDIRCNSYRSNIPFADFPNEDRSKPDDCGEAQENGFEPLGGKGAVARATLYFLLRYPREINNTRKEYTKDRIAVLLNWHNSEPVDLYEKHRNAAIQEKQGNRNPLIDFPEMAQRIDFARGLG